MKDGICPMCNSGEVYMTEKRDNIYIGGGNSLCFDGGEGRISGLYHFDTYVCLDCGYTALFAKPYYSEVNLGLTLLKNTRGWKKV